MDKTKNKALFGLVVGASVIGLVASFMQLLDKLVHLKNPTANLACNISSVFNCSNVLDAWQSSFFGFPNSIMCIVFFSVILGVALVGATGSSIGKILRLIMHFFAVFFLLFGAWYLWQSIYVIGTVCIYCMFCYAAVIAMNFAWTRINVVDLPFPKYKQKLIKRNWDVVFWTVWASAFVVMIVTNFYL